MSLSTGRSRPLDKVGLAPKQYTEWNEVGSAHSTEDLSQQGLLPEVRCTACTKGVFTKMTKYQRDPGLCALESYIAGDTLHHQPMGVGHMTVLQLWGPMGLRVLQWCHPMLACVKRTGYCTRIITLYGARKVDSGPRSSIPIHPAGKSTNFWLFHKKCIMVVLWENCL